MSNVNTNVVVVESTDSSNKEVVVSRIDSILTSLPTTSSKIRFLTTEGFSRSHIVLILSTPTKKMLYQHVRNVQLQILKKKI